MLGKRPVEPRVVHGYVERVGVQVAHGEHLVPALNQRPCDAGVEDGVLEVVVASDKHDGALAGLERTKQLVAVIFEHLGELHDRKPALKHGAGRLLAREAQVLADLQQRVGNGVLAVVHLELRADELDAPTREVKLLGGQLGAHLHVGAGVVVVHGGFHMAHGMDARHEDIVHPGICQLLHMAMEQLEREACLALRRALAIAHRLLVGLAGKQHVEAERFEERICHGEELVQHEGARNADCLLLGVELARVALLVGFLRTGEIGQVALDFLGIDLGARLMAAEQVEPLERRLEHPGTMPLRGGDELLGRNARPVSGEAAPGVPRVQSHQCRAKRARHREVGVHRDALAIELLERGHKRRVVAHAALQHYAPAHMLGPHHLVQVVAHNRLAQARCDLGLGGAGGKGRVDGRLHEHRAALAQIDRGGGREGERTVLGQRDTEPGRLFLYERARAGCADLVHLEVGHAPVAQRDVLGVLSADLEHGVYIGRHR